MQILKTIKIFVARLLVLMVLKIANAFIRIKRYFIKKLISFRATLQIRSLRTAIGEADKDKATTGRKNMVVFNTTHGQYEPVQKKLLKNVAKATKNNSNKAMTEGRKKMMKNKKKRVIDSDRIRVIEDKSLYVTR